MTSTIEECREQEESPAEQGADSGSGEGVSTVLSEPSSLQRGRLILGRSAVRKSVCLGEEGAQGRGQCAAVRQGPVWGV